MKNDANPPIRSATVKASPAFCDCDPMGVIWHGNYFRYLEQAREALFDSFDYGYLEMEKSGYIWPIVESRIKYIAPLICGQPVEITATMVEYENRIRVNYEIVSLVTGKRATKAQTTQIAVNKASNEMCFVSPPILFQKLGVSQP